MKLDHKYATHIPTLLRLVEATKGPILELGMGIFSTCLLDMMCTLPKRKLVSYDNDRNWFLENEKWVSEFHEVRFLMNWDKADVDNTHWSIVLIDHRPAVRRRVDAVRLKDKADFILLHDSEPEIDRFYRYSGIYKHFKYVYHYTKCLPNTTIVSNFIDPTTILGVDK